MGLGQFGGGLGAVQFLLQRGAVVTVTDLRPEQELLPALSQLETSSLAGLVLGEHREEDFTSADLIVVNPAVRPGENRFLQLARDHGIPLTSEMNLFWEQCRGRKIVVTGSVGKSTTATLIHQCLQAAGRRAWLGGNIGVSLLPRVDEILIDDDVVLELSSFQLADLDRLHPAPDVSVVTNFYLNHLDWHGSLDAYREAKQAAIAWQRPEQVAVLNGDDADSSLWPTDARVIWFGREVWQDRPGVWFDDQSIMVRSAVGGWRISLEDLAPSLRHRHGLVNVAAVLAAVTVGMEIPIPDFAPALQNFQSLPHRLEQVAQRQGRIFINDSKSTTPESTIAALQAVQEPVILIAGGKDKGADLTVLASAIAGRVKGVVCLGETGPGLARAISAACSGRASPMIAEAGSLDEALQTAWTASLPGDVILLSPACASHAEFINYERRGERFTALALTLPSDS